MMSVGATLNFGKTSGQLPKVDLHFWLRHWNMAGRGTPRQSRPMCSHIRRALSTTHYLVRLTPHSLALGHIIGLHSSSTQVADSSIPQLRPSLESSIRTCIGQLGMLVCNYTVHFCPHIVHSLESNVLATLLHYINRLRCKQ